MYKVFYNDRTVFFTQNEQSYPDNIGNKIHYFRNRIILKLVLKSFIDNHDIKNLYVIADNPERIFKIFVKFNTLIEAAGGLVLNKNNKVLFIFRRGKWDLPKGKIEKGENPEIAAIREVEEECGLSNLTITKLLDTTYHTYKLKGKDILKRTYWFEMLHDGLQEPIPQTEEEITEAIWFEPDNYEKVIQNTFPSIIEVMKKGNLIK
jgi:8-oxo-dGTP pyrophosphatase MutT (NUDIX family)